MARERCVLKTKTPREHGKSPWGSARLLLAGVKATMPRASGALDACEPHPARVPPRPGPVQRRAGACERRFRRVRAAAWRVSAAPYPVPTAPWRVRVHPCPVSITPWACVSRGLGVCEMTLGACQSSLGACHERLGISHLRQISPTVPRKAFRTGKTAGPTNVADLLPSAEQGGEECDGSQHAVAAWIYLSGNPAAARAVRSFALPPCSMTSPWPTITRSKSHPRIVANELWNAASSLTPALTGRDIPG